MVLGRHVLPLTPRTFSLLVATESRFILGGAPDERDVRNYLWFHSPLFAHRNQFAWRWRKRLALLPLNRELYQPWRRVVGREPSLAYAAGILALAITDIREIVEEAFADAPPAGGQSSRAPVGTYEAQMIHQFASAYQWTPDRTRNTPIKQLLQLLRCQEAGRTGEVKDTAEQEMLAAHLTRRNAELAKARAARAPVVTA